MGSRVREHQRTGTDLEEYLAEDTVCLFAESGGEYDGDTVRRCLHVNHLFITIMQRHELSLATAGGLELFLCLERNFKWRGKSVALEERDRFEVSLPLF